MVSEVRLQATVYIPPGTKAAAVDFRNTHWCIIYGAGEEVLTIHCLNNREMAHGIAAAVNGPDEL